MMPNHVASTRRQFLARASAAAVAAGWPGGKPAQAQTFHTKLHKAMIVGPVTEKVLEPIKAAGFEGVETRELVDEDRAAHARDIAQKMGMRIHSVMRGWAEFNSEDPARAESSFEVTQKAIRAASAYGADDILLVPCRVGGIPMPDPWAFKIEFDPKTLHVTRVVEGDNSKYEAYIAAQNRSTDMSRKMVEKLIPLAEERKVLIGLENVWNNLWVRPDFYKAFVESFDSPWVKSYYDIGNHVKYLIPPQDWIHMLGGLIIKLHFKGFKLNPDNHGGTFVHLRDDSIDWRAVRKALDDINYNGWGSIEENGLPYEEFARRFDLIMEGK
ncbi:MAG TPA: sugar phosphate isomerase/epimerase family protein [Tepidisphaeraceae bacterium]|jgi:hexulose-6-phosphate isomerase